jgi:hypothetical protein
MTECQRCHHTAHHQMWPWGCIGVEYLGMVPPSTPPFNLGVNLPTFRPCPCRRFVGPPRGLRALFR